MRAPGFCGSTRRGLLGAALAATLAGCDDGRGGWHARDVTGTFPPLDFAMTEATDGRLATAAEFRGKVTLVTFGYTSCPDICPTTLSNLAAALQRLGPLAAQLRVLFVTVDPARDTLAVLHDYTPQFAAQVVGLRGTADQLAALARRYRAAWSVRPGPPPEVSHSALVYVFDRSGGARLLISGLATAAPDLAGVTSDLRRLAEEHAAPNLWERLAALV